MDIISLAPSNTEIIYRLGMEDDLIATTSLCDYPYRAARKPSVGGWSQGVNIDKVKDLDPDLVLASDDLQDEVVKQLQKQELEVLQLKPHSLQEVYESIRAIGNELGCRAQAEKIVENMRTELNDIDLELKRIYCEEWMDPPMVSGNWIPGLIEKCNGQYFIEEGSRSREFKLEKLKQFDPEYIFLNVCGAGQNIDVSKVINREEWKDLQAIRDENIYVIDDAFLNRPGPRLVEGAKQINKFVE